MRRAASQQLYERAQRCLPGGNTRTTVFEEPFPSYASHGRGCVLVDVDGNELLDFLNNYTSLLHGHAPDVVVRAVSEQLRRGSAFSMPTESEIELAEEIKSRVPSVERIRFTNSGSEALMVAVHAARAAVGRDLIAKCEGAYHGFYDSVGVSIGVDEETWGPAEQPNVVPSSRGAAPGTDAHTVVLPFNDTVASERLIKKHADRLAAVIVDPLPNRIGLMPARPDYLSMLRRVTEQHGVLLVFDEVITFRLDHGGAQGRFGVRPDLTCFGKAIGGGLPVGAFGGAADVMDVLAPGGAVPHGGTFNANPLTMVAGKASLSAWRGSEVERLNDLGKSLRDAVNRSFSAAGVAGQALGDGSLFRIHTSDAPVRGYRDMRLTTEQKSTWRRVYTSLREQGMYVASSGFGCLSTPMGQAEIDRFVEAFEAALAALR